MSVNYAAGLSYYPHKGKCGQPEFQDSANELEDKISQLVNLFKKCKYCVVLTGAGISTSCGIPDFRGPKGVWTLEEKGVSPAFTTTFDNAKFSDGHLALVALEQAGYVKYLITQNVDGLHIRSGFPRDRMAILHGDMFTEQCDKCYLQYVRKTSVTTMGLKYTGNSCVNKSTRGIGCRGKLKDTILDWEDTLPDEQLEQATAHSEMADLFLVLGSSLQIVPAGNLPLRAKKRGGKFVSVNLQRTKHHKKTDIVINSSIDFVMKSVCDSLGVSISKHAAPNVRLHSVHCNMKSCPPMKINVDNDILCKPNDSTKLSQTETNFAVKQEEVDLTKPVKRKLNSTDVPNTKLNSTDVPNTIINSTDVPNTVNIKLKKT